MSADRPANDESDVYCTPREQAVRDVLVERARKFERLTENDPDPTDAEVGEGPGFVGIVAQLLTEVAKLTVRVQDLEAERRHAEEAVPVRLETDIPRPGGSADDSPDAA